MFFLPFLLSFDDWVSKHTENVSQVLRENNISAKFFVIWNTIENNSWTLLKLKEQWHTVCNHSFSHVDLTSIPVYKALYEIAKTSLEIKKVLGIMPTCFRPPYWKTNDRINTFANRLWMNVDWSLATWVLDTMDWDKNSNPLDVIKKWVNENTKEILMHDKQNIVTEEVLYIIKNYVKETDWWLTK